MPDESRALPTVFPFGEKTAVEVLQGNILAPGVPVDALVSTDDNYMTMGSGVSRLLANKAGLEYEHEARAQCPVAVGTPVVTGAYGLEGEVGVRFVLHGAVIDYDTRSLPLEQVVYQTTFNCMRKADEFGLKSILFPAFAAGAGGLSFRDCARQMCGAVKAYLAEDQGLERVYIILYLPGEHHDEYQEKLARNQRYIREANLVLGVPYNPVWDKPQIRDFYGRGAELERLLAVLSGDVPGKRHAGIVGGRKVGKSLLMDQYRHLAASQGRKVARVSFGRVHADTPLSFIYRKLLYALGEGEVTEKVREAFNSAHTDAEVDCDRFLGLLKTQLSAYPEIDLLIADLPLLMRMEAKDFWLDLDRIGDHVRIVFTADEGEAYHSWKQNLGPAFASSLEEISLRCVEEEVRRTWVDGVYARYLERPATEAEQDFVEKEAGRHPYLISLACHALISSLKPDALSNPDREYNKRSLAKFLQEARSAIMGPRSTFFDHLVREALANEDLFELTALAMAIQLERERTDLTGAVAAGTASPSEKERLAELMDVDPRLSLHDEKLLQMEREAYLVGADDRDQAAFMSESFEAWMIQSYGEGKQGKEKPPGEVMISLLGPMDVSESGEQLITTLIRGRGGGIITDNTPLRRKGSFLRDFEGYLRHMLHSGEKGKYSNLREIGDDILTRFTIGRVRAELKDLPAGSTVLLELDDDLKDIPWELMVEGLYTKELPFGMGRKVVSQPPSNVNPVVRDKNGKVRALLIGDPIDDLAASRDEVRALEESLIGSGLFEVGKEDVLIGAKECGVDRVFDRLESGVYGLVHYSGHSMFDGEKSAWVFKEQNIDTYDLTSSLRRSPPAMVFSSSCESGEAGLEKDLLYENQTFDLPGAFLQAGVEAYIGTLWEVDQTPARQFVDAFYRAFLEKNLSLGECLRRSKLGSRDPRETINRRAFILYGDPRIRATDLFPAWA